MHPSWCQVNTRQQRLQRCSGVNLPLTAADHASETSSYNPADIWIKAESASGFARCHAEACPLNLFGNLFLSERGFGHFRDRCLGTVHRLDECEPLVGDDPQSDPMGEDSKSPGISHAFFPPVSFSEGSLVLTFRNRVDRGANPTGECTWIKKKKSLPSLCAQSRRC
jgi:hypothetical protein